MLENLKDMYYEHYVKTNIQKIVIERNMQDLFYKIEYNSCTWPYPFTNPNIDEAHFLSQSNSARRDIFLRAIPNFPSFSDLEKIEIIYKKAY